MSTILGVLMIVAILSIPFFLARLMDRLTGKHRRMHRNKEITNSRRGSGAAQEARNDAHRKTQGDLHSPGGPGD
ncbi:hypothetical protein [Salimicrobium halophilum]|uniref:Uncharacterized protein n=1 Tax=Salimicrobium halophilum TaxID=86666 RepID=A0A1G8T245_9BACI|nr:hypothetical protein [Salimicrobium halophilum]SDJ35588.1 hypothetical protein SAMN04490247_1661 [Salimicrobium halophilum]